MMKRHKLIESLEDFKDYLERMIQLSKAQHPSTINAMQGLIKEADKLEHYDKKKISNYVDEIDNIRIDGNLRDLDNQFNLITIHRSEAERFRFHCESYFKSDAIELVIKDFERYLYIDLNNVKESDHEKSQFIDKLERIKRLKEGISQEPSSTDLDELWFLLYEFNENVDKNRDGFIIKQRRGTGGVKSRYKPYKKEIIELIKKVCLPKGHPDKITKETARIKIKSLAFPNLNSNKVEQVAHNTFACWMEEYKKTGDLFSKN